MGAHLGPPEDSSRRRLLLEEATLLAWASWVSDLLDYSEPSSRVFLFENILLLVVPTAAVCSSKRMIPLETIKRDMTTLGIITKSLIFQENDRSYPAQVVAAQIRTLLYKHEGCTTRSLLGQNKFDRCFTRPSTFLIQTHILVAISFSSAFLNTSQIFTKPLQKLCFSMATSPKETSAPGSPSVPSSPSSTKAPSNQEQPEFHIQPIQMIPGQAPVPEKLVPKRQQGVKISENPSLATSPREVDPEMDKKIRSIVSSILKNASVPDVDKDVPTSSTPNAEVLSSSSKEDSTEEEDQATEETPAPRAPEPAPGDLIDLEEVESDEEPIANKLAPGIAERLQSRKGKTPITRSGRIKTMAQKKSTPITPTTSRWSKVAISSKKRKEISSSDSDDDVELDVPDIKRAKKSGKKVPGNVPDAPLDNISFHSIGNVERWKFVYQRRLALERELGRDALDCKEIMDLIKAAGLLKTVTKLGDCYESLVREFIVNIPSDITNRKSDEYQKVFVRGKCVRFSPAVINKYLGRPTEGVVDIAVSEHQIAKEITAKQVQHWPKKGKLSAGKLSVKYAILHRIGAANWVPTNHTSTVATGLGKFLYAVGTKSKFNFGNYIFDQTVKHSESFAVKLPIAFPTVLCGIMLSQHPNILNYTDSVKKRESALSLHYKLFEGTHVPDIVSTSGKAAASGAVSKDALIAELKDTCKVLEATIKATTEKKMELERLIKRLSEINMGTNQTGKRFYQVKIKGLDITSIKELGRLMGPLQMQAFRKMYGKILDLTIAEISTEAIASLTQYYDQPLRCFTFGDFQLVPTIEEFEEILGCPLGGRKPYLFSGFLPSLSRIAIVIKDSARGLDRVKQARNGIVGLPRKYLEDKARDMANQEEWVPFMDVLALLIFGVVLFPNVDGLVDLATIDAFLAYHHSKESPVVAILANLFDTFDRRCEKSSTRIICCLPALCVWLVPHVFQQNTRHPCPLQSHRSCGEKRRVDWDQHLARIGGRTISWFPRWKEGKEEVLFSCGEYPNIPLIGTRGCINYNPTLAIRQLGYPMRGASTEESLSPFLVRDFGAQSFKVIQRIHKAWENPLRKDKELRGIRNGIISDWLTKLKVISEESFEAPEEDEEVQALKNELGKARLAKEKFKLFTTDIRKECAGLREENATTTRALEQETKRACKEEYGRKKFRGALWGSNSELKLRREERDQLRAHGVVLKEELVACSRSKRNLSQRLCETETNMLAIIAKYQEELSLATTHEHRVADKYAQVYAKKEARGRVIDSLHQEATMWMDRFALTLNGSQEFPRLLAKAKAMADTYSAPEEIHGLLGYCQHMIDLMAYIIRNR
ncbi:hypothetical protein HKD37_18G051226 [Glycine soja]